MILVTVTGATGFVGGAVVEALRSEGGITVRVLSRTHYKSLALGEVVIGDIGDVATCDRLVKGADVVVHTAGLVRSEDEAALQRINVDGTRTLVRAARRAGVPRFVHLSSTGVYGLPGTIVNEMSPHRPTNPYERSKSRAEAAVEDEWGCAGSVVIRPSNIIGAGHPLRPLRRLLASVKAGRPIVNAGAWSNYVGIRDVARVVAAVAMIDVVPSSLIINVPIPLDNFLMSVGEAVGRPARSVGLPNMAGRLLAPVAKSASRYFPWLARAAALLDQTRFCTIHDAWFDQYRLKPKIEPVLLEIAKDYGIVPAQ
jgi:nucleoside-diphosphate-sugar epimerase